MTHSFTDTETDSAFQQLATAIAAHASPWRDYDGAPIDAPAAEAFMLMQRADDGTLGFKHIDTRNYVYLSAAGRLYVPCTDTPFNRGYFA